MTERERMLAELPYRAFMEELPKLHMENKVRIHEFNTCRPDDTERLDALIRSILGKTGKKIVVQQPFHADYGRNIEVGENFFANYNLCILDVAKVKIGDNVMFAPNVMITAAGHPVHPEARNSGYEYGIGVEIGDNVWLGANVVVNPGVHIGSNSVIGSGSVVTKDIPDWVVAAGNPCRVLRKITEEDKKYYFKKRPFDVDYPAEEGK